MSVQVHGPERIYFVNIVLCRTSASLEQWIAPYYFRLRINKVSLYFSPSYFSYAKTLFSTFIRVNRKCISAKQIIPTNY